MTPQDDVIEAARAWVDEVHGFDRITPRDKRLIDAVRHLPVEHRYEGIGGMAGPQRSARCSCGWSYIINISGYGVPRTPDDEVVRGVGSTRDRVGRRVVSKWVELIADFTTVHLRLVVPDWFDPGNDEHVQYMWDHIHDWVYDPDVDDLTVNIIATPGPQRVNIVDGFGDDAKVLRTEMRDPRPDGTITDTAIPNPDPPEPAPPVDPNQGVLL